MHQASPGRLRLTGVSCFSWEAETFRQYNSTAILAAYCPWSSRQVPMRLLSLPLMENGSPIKKSMRTTMLTFIFDSFHPASVFVFPPVEASIPAGVPTVRSFLHCKWTVDGGSNRTASEWKGCEGGNADKLVHTSFCEQSGKRIHASIRRLKGWSAIPGGSDTESRLPHPRDSKLEAAEMMPKVGYAGRS